MTALSRCVTLFSLLMLSIACTNADRPTAPSSPPTVYIFSGPLGSYPVQPYTSVSKYVLYGNGAFALQSAPFGRDYVGTYRQENGVITFRFAVADRWDATGTLIGDSLEVRYNPWMGGADFEDAVYTRSQ